jgi:5-(carboxyamino)imidazole ribonucleotide synthase
VRGSFHDPEGAREVARRSDVVTLDTEHIPASSLREVEALAPLRPGAAVLENVQDRLAQKRFLDRNGLPTARYASVEGPGDFEAAVELVGAPSILKTRRDGYDGQGQARVDEREGILAAFSQVGERPSILEARAAFEREISVILARGIRGNVRVYPLAENVHRHHRLHTSRVPADTAPIVAQRAEEIARSVAESLGHVGVLAIELFEVAGGELLVNEIAPRVHNSGHYTLGACVTSQFEQHLRAVCGVPLGETTLLRPAVMVNLLGDLWQAGEPRWDAILGRPHARLHLYGKKRTLPGRKMGHVLLLGQDTGVLLDEVDTLLRELGGSAA